MKSQKFFNVKSFAKTKNSPILEEKMNQEFFPNIVLCWCVPIKK